MFMTPGNQSREPELAMMAAGWFIPWYQEKEIVSWLFLNFKQEKKLAIQEERRRSLRPIVCS